MTMDADLILKQISEAKKSANKSLNPNSIELMCFDGASDEFKKVSEICSFYSLEAEIKQNTPFIDCLINQNSENCLIIAENKDEIEIYVEIALRAGYLNCVCTTHSADRVAEGWKNKIFAYDITPEALEITSSNYKIILYTALALYISKKAPSVYSASLMAKAQF